MPTAYGTPTASRQRFAYLGGAGTLPTIEGPLSLGGDELFFAETLYDIPLAGLTLPMIGNPVLALHHLIGSAGVQRLPAFTQNAGEYELAEQVDVARAVEYLATQEPTAWSHELQVTPRGDRWVP